MTTFPKISIVTPSFNQGKYLEKTILSVIGQGYPNLEYIIIDGGSTDESVEIIKKYEQHLAYWVSEPDRGQSHAINKGFARATGEIFGWLNSDDWYHPGALKAVAEAFAANPEAGAVVGAGDMLYEETGKVSIIEPFQVTVESLYGAVDRFFAQPSCFFTSKAWEYTGPLDENLHLAMDLDLWLRIAKRYQFAVTEENLSTSLVHSTAKTKHLASQSLVDACLVIMRHGGMKAGRARLVGFLEELHDCRGNLVKSHENTLSLYRELEHLTNQKNREIDALRKSKVALERQIHMLTGSLSWRLTSPIRRLLDVLTCLSNVKGHLLYFAYSGFAILERNIIAKNVWMMDVSLKLRMRFGIKSSKSLGEKPVYLTNKLTSDFDFKPLDVTISVVIPTKNAGNDYELLLKSILSQKGIDRIEIVVIDSGSRDRTIILSKEYDAKVIEIQPEQFSHSYARNLGAENSSGDFIFFTVQDALLPSDMFFYELVTVYCNNEVTAISCAEFPRHDADMFYRVCLKNHYNFLEVDNCDRIFFLPEIQNYETLRKNGQLSDLACFIGRDDFYAFKYRFEYAEDLDLGVRLIKSGHKIAFLGSLKVIHSHNRTPYYYLKRGYADQIFLTRTFPDYPTRIVHADSLAKEICGAYIFVSRLIREALSMLPTPYSVNALEEAIEVFAAKGVRREVEDCGPPDGGLLDEQFLHVIEKLAKKYPGAEYCSLPGNGFLVDDFIHGINPLMNYMKETYVLIDNDRHLDFCRSMFKQMALISGVSIANSSLYDAAGVNDMLEVVSLNILSGV